MCASVGVYSTECQPLSSIKRRRRSWKREEGVEKAAEEVAVVVAEEERSRGMGGEGGEEEHFVCQAAFKLIPICRLIVAFLLADI